MKLYSSLKRVCTLLIFFISFTSLQAQDEPPGVGDFCFDPAACNYNPIILGQEDVENDLFTDRGIIIIGNCQYPQWYIPLLEGAEFPAMFSCNPIEGYIVAESQCCVANVVASDAYCINFEWDFICADEYDFCRDNLEGCNDPEACNYDYSAFCADNSTCTYTQWYIPTVVVSPGNFPAVEACSAPEGYSLAEQCCVLQVIFSDGYCVNTNWDFICSGAYQDCLIDVTPIEGCTDPIYCNYNPFACVNDGYCMGIKGCTDETACNYQSYAGCDDGSCEFPGCMDPQALNYDPVSLCGDVFSCYYCNLCPGDMDGDFAVTVGDLTIFLAAFGTVCEPIIFN